MEALACGDLLHVLRHCRRDGGRFALALDCHVCFMRLQPRSVCHDRVAGTASSTAAQTRASAVSSK
jgi:hypothetical protein